MVCVNFIFFHSQNSRFHINIPLLIGSSTDEWTFIETNENDEDRSDDNSSSTAAVELAPPENTDKLHKIDHAELSCINNSHAESQTQNASTVQTKIENVAKIDTITQLP